MDGQTIDYQTLYRNTLEPGEPLDADVFEQRKDEIRRQLEAETDRFPLSGTNNNRRQADTMLRTRLRELAAFKGVTIAKIENNVQSTIPTVNGFFNPDTSNRSYTLDVAAQVMTALDVDVETDEDVDEWHRKYCDAVQKLYYQHRSELDKYRGKEMVLT